ncbi:type II toxin-antitoxin system death-on-curing family toxin [Crenothrix polyspora]|uniref:Death on curing protein n=1 Tax=Crenothrix polyspora TaxID=360316 RepID=A0A1R4GYP5_9GAMM|nr:type II toxin-antitoxin system death-on-curing family toxin [Crenothrix polyspora]SJM89116.1 Death on curing protein [Crenothrix polyspora]
MLSWHWIDKQILVLLHDESLVLHGGASGIRDEGLLDSAMNRAVNLALYGEPDFADLAAAYGIALAKNHAFVDGNKRVAFLAVGLFFGINGYKLTATQENATSSVMAVASGEMSEAEFAAWIRANSQS